MNGLILIDKPENFTSFDVIAVARKLTGQRKIGHTGTLDPNATGVLPLLLGSASKAQDLIVNHDKTYVADFRLGITTDTLDIWGRVKTERQSNETTQRVLDALQSFRGEIYQLPPMFSAVQKNGQRLYDLARKGIEVEREKRKVTVYRLELLGFDEKTQSGRLEIECSRGTYVRTLIDDLGGCLGAGAVMTGLRRIKACGFSIDECVTLDRLRELSGQNTVASVLRSTDSLFDCYAEVRVSDGQAKRFSNGGALDLAKTALKNSAADDGTLFRVYSAEDFLGLGRLDRESGSLKIYKLFK